MLDSALISINGGCGGNGAVSGRREKFIPTGGPDGGDGGDGGSVSLRCNSGLSTLSNFRRKRKFTASDGTAGAGRKKHGRDGLDVDIEVPEGTEVWEVGKDSGHIADLTSHGQQVLLAKGGKGGRGNVHFTTSINRYSLLAEEGERGQSLELRLELKLLADVGIVGAPNVGKSSLLRAVSAAKPVVADYPFTTLEPVVGVVDHRAKSFVMVDIPGLVEGAHRGKGLGDEFLRHVERTRVLLHVLDGTSDDLETEYRKIRSELALFGESLSKKQEVVVINKLDVPGVRERGRGLKMGTGLAEDGDTPLVSAVAGIGIDQMLDRVIDVLAKASPLPDTWEVKRESSTIPVLRPAPLGQSPKVYKQREGEFVIRAPQVERVAAMVDNSNWNAVVQFREYLRKLGVVAALDRAGVRPGDVVKIGKLALAWA